MAGSVFPIAWATAAGRVSGRKSGRAVEGKTTVVEAAKAATWETFAMLGKTAAGSADVKDVDCDEDERIKPDAKRLNVERGIKILTIVTKKL